MTAAFLVTPLDTGKLLFSIFRMKAFTAICASSAVLDLDFLAATNSKDAVGDSRSDMGVFSTLQKVFFTY